MPPQDAPVPIPRIVFLDRNTMGPGVRVTRPRFMHEWIEHDATAPDAVAERLAGAVIAVSNKTPIRARQMPHRRFPRPSAK